MAAGVLLAASSLLAQQDRIASPVDISRSVVLKGNRNPRAQAQYDRGPVDPSLELAYVTLLLKPSPEQQSALEQLLAEQQTPSSPNYHKWLTPEQYAGRFGLSRGDVARVVSWLESAGLKVNDVARGRHWMTFTGTAARVGSALRTGFHRYVVEGEMRYANATEPSVPAALADVVAGVRGLDNFRERSSAVSMPADMPAYTSGSTHYMAPDDFATIYRVNTLYQAGIDGAGQKIAILGQTDINVADVRSFRSRYNLPPNDPQVFLFGRDPGASSSDQVEAYLDLEWAGAVARNATIIYVNSTDVGTSAQYAVDQDLAQVMSFSYTGCEQENTPSFRSVAQQAAALGITWMASSGDSGANSCDRHGAVQSTKGLAAGFPASIPEVTAVGGTMFDDAGGSYWGSNGPNLSSALSYIPEKAWNETNAALTGLASTGGGVSVFFAKPAWQTGPGVPHDNARDVPDVSLSAAIHDGYLTFHDGANYVNGGTSASAPAFAGIVALLNQYLASNGALAQPGLGNINPALYRLAQNTTDVFHDVTAGDNLNPCAQAAPNCVNGQSGYAAGPNYDLATGLGSIDAYNLVTEWSAQTGSPTATRMSTDVSSVDLNGSVRLLAAVGAPAGGTPTGTVTFTVGNNDSSLGSAALVLGVAALTVPATTLPLGTDTLWAVYSGDGSFNGSAASATVNVTLPPVGSVVIASIAPNPVYQSPADALGFSWFYTITLREVAGVATTLTGFSINGASQTLSNFFSTTDIPAKGTVSVGLRSSGLNAPMTRVFGFTGTDATGISWSRQVTVSFGGPGVVTPRMLLTSPAGAVEQNPNADPACQWSQPVYVQETGGFTVQLTKFTAGANSLSDQIQQTFGATRLAPFGMLAGTVCWGGIPVPPPASSYSITGVPDGSGTVTASLSTKFAAAAATTSKSSVTPAVVTLTAGTLSDNPTANVALAFDAGSPQWTVTVVPGGRTNSWLTVSQASGSGSATLVLKASSTGLSNGVYNATLAIQAAGAVPQYLNVTVAFVVGAVSTMSIGGASNVFSGGSGAAPGMLMAVYGAQLANTTQLAAAIPLPLSMGAVSATVNGVSAPLYYVSPGQLNIQIPYETGAGTAVLGVNNNGKLALFTFSVAAAAPGLWPNFIDLAGAVTATAKQGDTLVTFMTGEGDVTPPLTDGATPAAGTSVNNLPQARLPVAVTVGGVPATVLFAGIPRGNVGVTQINFTVPTNAPAGDQPVVVTVGGTSSAPVTLTVR